MKTLEGGIGAPTRSTISWREDDFKDTTSLDREMRRVFDVCHSCRRCFNLCESFPRLFDLIDNSKTGELESVGSNAFSTVTEACTLCDMCFMTKCPYVPPHEFNIDFPNLMLRYRVANYAGGKELKFGEKQLVKTDWNGRVAGFFAPIANWAISRKNRWVRLLIQLMAKVHKEAILPKFHRKSFVAAAALNPDRHYRITKKNHRKAVLYVTCLVNFNLPSIGVAANKILGLNGVRTEIVYPECCGMPVFESGDIEAVAGKADRVATVMEPWIDKNYDVITLTPSCGLMMKSHWPLLLPENDKVLKLSKATKDICEYVVDIAKKEGLAEGLKPMKKRLAVHLACHARAQNIGPKAVEMLSFIPGIEINSIERCSGHGGTFGVKTHTFPLAKKFGESTAKKVAEIDADLIVSECPLAGKHIVHLMAEASHENPLDDQAASLHPIELLAQSYEN